MRFDHYLATHCHKLTSEYRLSMLRQIADAIRYAHRKRVIHRALGPQSILVMKDEGGKMKAEMERAKAAMEVKEAAILFQYLRAVATELDIDWGVIELADGADRTSQDWTNLLHVISLVAPKIEADLLNQNRHLLLVHPGLIARYDQMAILETLRDRTGHDVPCPGVWVLVATDEQSDMPLLDHAEIPLISPGQRAKVSEPWIVNEDRGRTTTGEVRNTEAQRKRRVQIVPVSSSLFSLCLCVSKDKAHEH